MATTTQNNLSMDRQNNQGGRNMAKLNISFASMKANARIDELNVKLEGFGTKRNPDYYKNQRERDLYEIIDMLLQHINEEQIDVPTSMVEHFERLTTTVRQVIIVNEGDDVMVLLDKYKDVKDVYHKIQKACEAKGLKMVGASIVKA